MQLRVFVTIVGGPATYEVKKHPKHKKNPAIGEKEVVYASTVLIEQEDAKSFELNEEVRRSMFALLWIKLIDKFR